MASQQELFHESGPRHLLSSVDWTDSCYRRSVAASLVRGVYILEKDRQRQNTQGDANANAPPWWEQFHFKLNKILVDDSDLSYFGAIFELEYQSNSNPYPPRFVIAFRGTISRSLTESDDLKLNIKCIFNKLEQTPRFRKAFKTVWDMVATVGPTNVWLAGHSLGASIAMLAGRNMAKSRYHLETYLFNPPFISVPLENMIKNESLKHSLRIGRSFLKAGIAKAMHRRKKDPGEDSFVVLSEWKPYVFVNPSDPICAEYIGYFEHRGRMEEIGVASIERIATRHSIGSLVSRAIGSGSEPMHLLPTAYLTVNISSSEDSTQAHKLHQWWQRDFQCKSELYKFK